MLRSGHMERAKRPPFLGGSAKASFLLAQHTKAEQRDADQQDGDREQRQDELRPDLPGQPPDDPDEPVVDARSTPRPASRENGGLGFHLR